VFLGGAFLFMIVLFVVVLAVLQGDSHDR